MTIEKKTDQVDPNPGIHAGEFDLSQRPQSYLLESVEDAISILVSGEYRRFRIRLGVESKDVEALPNCLFSAGNLHNPQSVQERELQYELNHLYGPLAVGGEFLPKFYQDEVEIARLCLNSFSSEVISIRAQYCEGRWHYRIVDEYCDVRVLSGLHGGYLAEYAFAKEPLTFGELCKLLENAVLCKDGFECSLLRSHLDELILGNECEPDELYGFMSGSSFFYPQFSRYVDQYVTRYVDGQVEIRTQDFFDALQNLTPNRNEKGIS